MHKLSYAIDIFGKMSAAAQVGLVFSMLHLVVSFQVISLRWCDDFSAVNCVVWAQKLSSPVTRVSTLKPGQRLYLLCRRERGKKPILMGGLKVGRKDLLMRQVQATEPKRC